MLKDGRSAAEVLDVSLQLTSDVDLISEYKLKWEADRENDLIRFQYAQLLSKSPKVSDKHESVKHLEYLIGKSVYLKDSLYDLAVVKYALGDYHAARVCCEELFRQEPDNAQVRRLHAALSYKQEELARQTQEEKEQAVVGVAVGLGVVAAVGVGLAFLLKKK